jgi:hypothetical protein
MIVPILNQIPNINYDIMVYLWIKSLIFKIYRTSCEKFMNHMFTIFGKLFQARGWRNL